MNNEKIAVFISGRDGESWKVILEGIQQKAKEENCSLSIFSCAGSLDISRKFDVGEFNIFRLANMDMYDGIIIVSCTIICKEVEKELFEAVKKYPIPIISMEIEEEGMAFAGIDNYDAMRDMIEHLLDFHKYESLGFIAGPGGNQESVRRLNAYEDVLKEHGMEVREEDIFYGNYGFQSGLDAAEYFVSRKSGLPRAIASSNDEMAMGLIRGFEKHGIKVPRDIAVTGFDDIADAANFEPRISSVMRPRKELGALLCENLIRKIRKEDSMDKIVCKTKPVFRESCGCWIRCGKSFKEFRHDYFVNRETNFSNSAILNEMTEKLTDCDTFNEMLENLKDYIPFLRCGGLYLCVSPEVKGHPNGIDSPDFMRRLKKYEKDVIVAYPERMTVLAAFKDGSYFEADDFDTKQLLPDCEKGEEAKTYLFSPIHFQDRCLGYTIIVNPDFEMNGQSFYQWLMNVNISIENIRRKNAMNDALQRLEEMYIRDGLTNLYNRFGFERYSKEIYRKCKNEKRAMLILFADLNRLKHINDDFGHENGDIAIKTIAKVLIESKMDEDVCTRFGGDEFILMGYDYTASKAEELIKKVEEGLQSANTHNNYPYSISASMGYYIIESGSEISLKDAIDMADHHMYQAKKQYMEQLKK